MCLSQLSLGLSSYKNLEELVICFFIQISFVFVLDVYLETSIQVCWILIAPVCIEVHLTHNK